LSKSNTQSFPLAGENANGSDISSALVAIALLMTSWALIFTLAPLTATHFPPLLFFAYRSININ